jgi:hypothetical protein
VAFFAINPESKTLLSKINLTPPMPKNYNHPHDILRRHLVEYGRKLCFYPRRR